MRGRAQVLAVDGGEDFTFNVGDKVDGPSAGVAVFVALTSLLTGRPVRSHVAMTGEINLRGLVLPIGGVKEKVLAALRAGITTVMLPARNERDLEDIPADAPRAARVRLTKAGRRCARARPDQ